MKVVIQCAATKSPHAGRLKTRTGRPVQFVARPADVPADRRDTFHYARPDDVADDGRTWRQQLCDYNARPDNPHGLLPAHELYTNPVYGDLVAAYGSHNVLVLSAGWGLVRSTYLLPDYSITFSNSADKHERRPARDTYDDFALGHHGGLTPEHHAGPALGGQGDAESGAFKSGASESGDAKSGAFKSDDAESLVLFGGISYLKFFDRLTTGRVGRRLAFHNSVSPPSVPGVQLIRYETAAKTNWHYRCARAFLNGDLDTSTGISTQ